MQLIKRDVVVLIILAAMLGGCITQQSSNPLPPPAPVVAPPSPPPPEPVAAPAPVPTSEKVSFSEEIRFASNSASLDPAAKAALAGLLNKMGDASAEVFVVVGHSDNTLKPAAAKRLSMRRADATKDYLVSRGIDTARIYTEAQGSSQPSYPTNTASERAKNNRVTIEIVAVRPADVDPTAWVPNNVIPVLYATNRKPTGSTNPFYFYGNQLSAGTGASALEHGVAAVRVPRERERGALRRPPSVTLVFERAAESMGMKNLPKLALPNPETDFLYEHKIHVLTPSAFKSTLKEAVTVSKSKTAILYVHGYNNDFTDAAFRTAQMVYDMAEVDYDLVPLMFSWPSDPGIPGLDYKTAGDRTEISSEALAAYLRDIAQTTDIGTVHIVAHSMGSRVLASALEKLGTKQELTRQKDGASVPVFKHIVFAAADISPAIFEKLIEPVIKSRHTVTSYISSNDKILWLSQTRNLEPRIGFGFKHLPKCVDSIDVSAAGRRFAHSTWADSPPVIDDLRNLTRYSIAPALRGLHARTRPGQTYWALQTKVPAKLASIGAKTHHTLLPCANLAP